MRAQFNLFCLTHILHQRCGVGHERMRVSPQDRANSELRSVATRRRQEEGDAQIDKMKKAKSRTGKSSGKTFINGLMLPSAKRRLAEASVSYIIHL